MIIPGVTTYKYTKIIGMENISFGKNIIIDDFVFIYAKAKMHIGNYVHIASHSSITGGAEYRMEDFSGLSQGVRIITGTEDFLEWGFGNPTIPEKFRNVRREPIYIGRFVIVGANSVVLPGVIIGEGAMVGANSVVTKSLEPWGIYVGNKKVKERNKEDVLKTHSLFLKEVE